MKANAARWVVRARGPLGRGVRWWLVMAGDRGDHVATDAVWQLWLDKPDRDLWAALARWRRPHTRGGQSLVALGRPAAVADVVAAACRVRHPIAVTARAAILAGQQDLVDAACAAVVSTPDEELAALCVEHHLAPADPAAAAMFFLLTGQDEQYRVADPDHSLLALAYQGAAEEVRSRVRARVAGDQDLVRALAGTVGRRARVSDREADYLVDAYAGRQDWAGVWRLAKDLPVIDAAAAVRRCVGWRPAGPDAALFDALAAMAPAELAASRRAALEPVCLPAAGTFRGSMAPDGRVAVSAPRWVDVFTFPDGEYHQRVPTALHGRMLALDNDVLIVSHTDEQPGEGFSELGYVPPSGVLGTVRACRFQYATTLNRTADGFAALTYDYRKHIHRLHLLSGAGPDFRTYDHEVLDVLAELGIVSHLPAETYRMAVDSGSGRLVIARDTSLHFAEITSDGLRKLATTSCRSGFVRRLAFSGPDRLLRLIFGGTVQVWRLAGDDAHLAVERQLHAQDAVDLPAAGVVAIIPSVAGMPRRVRYLDGETLEDVPTPSQFHGRGHPEHLFASPDGDLLGVGYSDVVEVLDTTLIALAARPLAATTPADLRALRARLDRAPANRFLELLYACLVHRFGLDVALGDGGMIAGMITGRADDIALGGTA